MEVMNSNLIEQAVYNLCIKANTEYSSGLYDVVLAKYNNAQDCDLKIKYANILNNIKLAFDSKRPLCQDTGQVLVFVKIGSDTLIEGKNIVNAVNSAVSKAYCENFYRKSVVANSLFNRVNTENNTPAIVYTEIVEGDEISIDLMVKGAGSENCSAANMFVPSAPKEDIFKFIKDTIVKSGEKSCPPLVIGVGIGGTIDYAALLSKKAFFHNETEAELGFIDELKKYLGPVCDSILDVHLMSSSTHIASLPVALTINCHSCRHSSCKIVNSQIVYLNKNCEYQYVNSNNIDYKRVHTSDIKAIRDLKQGDNILLSGEIYTARDAAHKRMKEYYEQNGSIPFDLKGKVVFYAGPCPAANNEVIGPIGPTTSARMDEYCELTYSNGVVATIGKGERSENALKTINKYNGKYFVAQGGISCLLSKCVKKSEMFCFEDLGTEAVRKLYVENLPLKVFC